MFKSARHPAGAICRGAAVDSDQLGQRVTLAASPSQPHAAPDIPVLVSALRSLEVCARPVLEDMLMLVTHQKMEHAIRRLSSGVVRKYWFEIRCNYSMVFNNDYLHYIVRSQVRFLPACEKKIGFLILGFGVGLEYDTDDVVERVERVDGMR